MMSNRKKYILCVTCGEIYDTLSGISQCYNYCKKNNRTLLIDTSRYCVFSRSFDNYFEFINQEIPVITNFREIMKIITQPLTVYPSCLTDKLCYFMIKYDKGKIYYPTTETTNKSQIIDFDYYTTYNEDILVYCQYGRERITTDFLLHLRLNNDYIKKNITERIDTTNEIININNYVGIHIKHADVKTDHIKLFEENKDLFMYSNVYLSTDSKEAQTYFKNNVQNMISINDTKLQASITYTNTNYETYMTNIADVLYDLYMLVFSNYIIYGTNSGYIMLARILYNNKDIAIKIYDL